VRHAPDQNAPVSTQAETSARSPITAVYEGHAISRLAAPFEDVIKACVAPDEQHYSMTVTSPKHAFWNAPLFGIAMKTGYRLCFENTNEFERTQF
jgi:hypothetical protein